MLVFLLSGVCGATVGNPVTAQILGLDAADRKVYVLLDGGADYPRLQFVQLDKRGEWVQVESWYVGQHWEERLEERLATLQARLLPLESRPLTGLVVQESIGAERPCPNAPEEYLCVAHQVQVQIRDGAGHQAQWSQLSQGKSGLVGAWTLPSQEVLVFYRHQGLFFEGGYSVDVPVLLSAPGAPLD